MSYTNNQEPQPIVEEPCSDNDEKKDALTVSKVDNTIFQENYTIRKQLEKLMTIMKLIESFKSTATGTASARQFADEVQKNSKELVTTQAALRQCMQSVLNVESYKPVSMDQQQKETWDLIDTFRREIRKAVINVNDVTAEWFGYLTLLRHGLVFFYESMANGIGTPENSISEFQSAARDFCEFYKKNVGKFNAVREKSEEAMQKILEKFHGRQAIANALKARQKFEKELQKQRQKLTTFQKERLKEVTPINQKIARLKGELAQHDLQLRYENEEISNLEKEQRSAAYRARKNEEAAESKTNYKREKRTTNIFGWELYNYYKDVYTGDHDKYKSIADKYRNMRDKALNTKAAKTNIIKLATQHKIEIERKIADQKAILDVINQDYNEQIDQIHDNITQAKEEYKSAELKIKNAIKTYGVNRPSILPFLNSTNILSQESLKALEVTKKVEVAIKTFSQLVKSKCRTVYRIDWYFIRDGVNLERMIEPLTKNHFVTLRDLECNDEKQFNEEILPHIQDIANKREIYKIKKLSYIESEKWKQGEQKLAASNVQNLMNQVPPLAVFFPSVGARLSLAMKMLNYKDGTDNAQTLKMIPLEIEELENEDKENRKSNTLPIINLKEMCEEQKEKEKEKRKMRRKKNKKNKKKKHKKDRKHRRKKKYESSSEEESTSSSEEESTSEDESSEDRRRIKKDKRRNDKKHHKKRKKKYSSDSDSDDSHSDNYKSDKRNKKSKKNKKSKNKKYSSDENNGNSSGNGQQEEKQEEKTITTEILLLKELSDKNNVLKAKCLDVEFDTVKILINEKWYKKLCKLLKKGKEKGVDVKVKVSTYKFKQEISDAYLDTAKEENNQKTTCVLTMEEIDGNIAKCIGNDFNTVDVKFDESEWAETLNQFLNEKMEHEEVRLEVSYDAEKQDIQIQYTILKAYKE